jgi:hypothetical protein
VLNILIESDPNIRFNMKHGMWTAGVNTPFELIQRSKNYTIKNIAQNIKCLTCPKKYILFTAGEGAEEHCQRKYT